MMSRISFCFGTSQILLLLVVVVLLNPANAFLTSNNPLESPLLKPKVRPFLESHVAFAKKKTDDNQQKQTQKHPEESYIDPLLEELKHKRISENPYYKLFHSDWKQEQQRERPEDVHVILFKPDTAQQSIHSIEYPKGSGSNFVLAFESYNACQKFAAELKAQNFGDPTPRLYNLDSLEDTCDELGVLVQVVPSDVDLVPPKERKESFGHNPHLLEDRDYLDYLFDMFELEVDYDGLLVAEDVGCWE